MFCGTNCQTVQPLNTSNDQVISLKNISNTAGNAFLWQLGIYLAVSHPVRALAVLFKVSIGFRSEISNLK